MMPCSDCKHWRTSRDPAHRNEGVCILMTEECRVDSTGRDLQFTPKTRIRQRKRRGLVRAMTTWTPNVELVTLSSITYTAPDFFCALYDRDKRKKPRQLPVVREDAPGTPPRRYQVILEEDDDAPV